MPQKLLENCEFTKFAKFSLLNNFFSLNTKKYGDRWNLLLEVGLFTKINFCENWKTIENFCGKINLFKVYWLHNSNCVLKFRSGYLSLRLDIRSHVLFLKSRFFRNFGGSFLSDFGAWCVAPFIVLHYFLVLILLLPHTHVQLSIREQTQIYHLCCY